MPSLFIAERLTGWTGAAAYAVVVAAILPIVLSLPMRMRTPTLRLFAIVTGLTLVAVVVIGHRTFDNDLPDRGSDDDSVGSGAGPASQALRDEQRRHDDADPEGGSHDDLAEPEPD